jgi:hypothetical protein
MRLALDKGLISLIKPPKVEDAKPKPRYTNPYTQ